MVSPVSSPANEIGAESATRNKIAQLARLHLQLSACEEQLNAVERQPSPVATKVIDQKALTSKIAAIKAQIAELARSDAAPAARAADDNDERKRPRARRSEQSPLDAVRLALVKEGHLGTLVNLRA
jgi:DNA-binding transcriptional MerR regulator